MVIFNFMLFPASMYAGDKINCLDCHDSLDKPVVHGAAAEDCTNCHKVDNADEHKPTGYPFFLTETVNKTCLNCHDITEGSHPVWNHPTSGDKDPLNQKKKFTCVSCHNPHQSQMPKLFRYDYSKNTPYKGVICATCHYRITFGDPVPPAPVWIGY